MLQYRYNAFGYVHNSLLQAACVLRDYAGVDVDCCSSSVQCDVTAMVTDLQCRSRHGLHVWGMCVRALSEPPALVLLHLTGTSFAMAVTSTLLIQNIHGTRQIAGMS